MPKLLQGLFGHENEYPIAVVQYERADYSVGNEEHLHWALIVITNEGDLTGPCWQVVDRHYSDGRGVVWELFDGNEVRLKMTKKCLGGVKIGTVKDKDLEFFATVSAQSGAVSIYLWNTRPVDPQIPSAGTQVRRLEL